ncbi:hypothetical protein ACS0TY_023178 [Phlomoides rotata]
MAGEYLRYLPTVSDNFNVMDNDSQNMMDFTNQLLDILHSRKMVDFLQNRFVAVHRPLDWNVPDLNLDHVDLEDAQKVRYCNFANAFLADVGYRKRVGLDDNMRFFIHRFPPPPPPPPPPPHQHPQNEDVVDQQLALFDLQQPLEAIPLQQFNPWDMNGEGEENEGEEVEDQWNVNQEGENEEGGNEGELNEEVENGEEENEEVENDEEVNEEVENDEEANEEELNEEVANEEEVNEEVNEEEANKEEPEEANEEEPEEANEEEPEEANEEEPEEANVEEPIDERMVVFSSHTTVNNKLLLTDLRSRALGSYQNTYHTWSYDMAVQQYEEVFMFLMHFLEENYARGNYAREIYREDGTYFWKG